MLLESREARIARIAFWLGRATALPTNAGAGMIHAEDEILSRFVHMFEDGRPCNYKVQCLRDGRCPFDPVCNN